MKQFRCRAILFDLDGVLVDSTGYIEEQWRGWALSKGLAPEPFLEVCHGRRAVETIRLAAPHLDAEAEVAAFVPQKLGDTALRAVIGARELLAALPVGSWAVATSGPREGAIERLRCAGLPVPDVFICAEDVLRGKPSPDVYLKAAAELSVAPADCIVIEDAPAGISAARAAAMRVIALTTTHPIEQLLADARVDSLAAIQVRPLDHGRQLPVPLELLIRES